MLVPSQVYHVVIPNTIPVFRIVLRPCHASGRLSPATHCGGWGSISAQSLSALCWWKYRRDRIFSEHFKFLLPVSFHLCSVSIYWFTTDIIWYHKLTPSLKNTLKVIWVEYTEACCRRRHSILRKIGCVSSMGLNSFLLLCLMLWQHNSGHVRCWCDVHASYTCVYWSINT